ncbi:hypothetical protein [Nostoc sp. FACHB-888]|uniref:hypothetical protein n=1 Tax=Nostoc sp. FACHB-888 TaxID=2692842 RepID=UPI001682B09E|nr:hypothetical protein [Nostoc sp. FACHB-888]MBD2249423.1 hypothetical protein [Nostoc sp. FACHB-888]
MKASLKTRAALTAGIMLGGITILSPGAVLSQSATPGNITGRWDIQGNASPGVLRITQSGNGSISGTIYGQAIEGFYVPSVRRLVFIRRAGTAVTSAPFQFYEGWISINGLRIGGEFKVWNTQNGASASGVDFNFSGTKASDFP